MGAVPFPELRSGSAGPAPPGGGGFAVGGVFPVEAGSAPGGRSHGSVRTPARARLRAPGSTLRAQQPVGAPGPASPASAGRPRCVSLRAPVSHVAGGDSLCDLGSTRVVGFQCFLSFDGSDSQGLHVSELKPESLKPLSDGS